MDFNMDDPFMPSSTSSSSKNGSLASSRAPTSYTIMSPRAYASSSATALNNLLETPSDHHFQYDHMPAAHARQHSVGSTRNGTASSIQMLPTTSSSGGLASPSTIMRAVSPPTPAPSPQPASVPFNAASLAATSASPSSAAHSGNGSSGGTADPSSVLMSLSTSAALGEPGTPVSPCTEDPANNGWSSHHHSHLFNNNNIGNNSIHDAYTNACFAEQFIQSIVTYYPRLSGPERRNLFTSLLPYMAGEDLLHLSQLISPYLRRDFLGELPVEIGLQILSFIDDPKDLVRASRVSRTWRSLVADEQNWKLMLEKYKGRGWNGEHESQHHQQRQQQQQRGSTASNAASPARAGLYAPTTSPYYRAPIERIRMAHPSARFVNVGEPSVPPSRRSFHVPAAQVALPQETQTSTTTSSSSRSYRQQMQDSYFAAQAMQHSHSQPFQPRPVTQSIAQRTLQPVSQASLSDRAPSQVNMNPFQIPAQLLNSINDTSLAHMRRAPSNDQWLPMLGSTSAQPITAIGTSASPQSHVPIAGPISKRNSSPSQAEEGEVNRFLDENQTPLAERARKTKGKGRITTEGLEQDFTKIADDTNNMHGLLPRESVPHTLGGFDFKGLGVLGSQQGSFSQARNTIDPLSTQAGQIQTSSSRGQPPPLVSAVTTSIPSLIPPVAIPPPQDLTAHLQRLSLDFPRASGPYMGNGHDIASAGLSLSARFAPAYGSPAQILASHASGPRQDAITAVTTAAVTPGAPSLYAADRNSPLFLRRPSYLASEQTQSAPQPIRNSIIKSSNPFGIAQTNIVYTEQYLDSPDRSLPATDASSQSGQPFSWKTQFKKAYLTESNWLKGPGRLLSRQTCVDDGVVTSLGFDGDWIVVGMATKQIHIFDSKTGAYVHELVGHSSGVWCLVLVSKGGARVDKDGKKVKTPKLGDDTPDVFKRTQTSWGSDTDGEDAGDPDEDDGGENDSGKTSNEGGLAGHGMERMRSASARPPDCERFFQQASESFSASPTPSEGYSNNERPDMASRRLSAGGQSSKPAKHRTNRRPSSFCGVPSSASAGPSASGTGSASSGRYGTNPSGFPFGGDGPNISPQQAAACGTAQGWGQPGAVVVSGGCDRDVRVWDVETGRCIHHLRGHLSTVRCVKVLDGRPIAISGSRDNTLRVWDIEKGTLMHVLNGHTHSVRCMEISGNKVVSGSYDASCKIWDVDTGECLHTLRGHQHQIYAVAFDGVRVASGSLDSTVRIWSAKTGECLALLQGHTSLVGQLQLTDSLLVTGGSDGRVIVFSLSTFECLHRLCAHDNSVTCLQFNDRFMVTGGNDGRVKLWDRPSGKLIRDLAEPCEAVWRVTFREDKCVLLCKRGGKTIMEVRTFAPFNDEL